MPRNFRGLGGNHPPGPSFVMNKASPQANGLHFWTPIISDKGALIIDRVNGLIGTFTGGGSIVIDIFGHVASLGAGNEYINFGSPSHLDNLAVGAALSVSLWYWNTGNLAGERHMIDKRTPGGGWRIRRERSTTQRLQMNIEAATTDGNATGASGTLPDDIWNHIVATYNDNGDRKPRLYVNGFEIAYTTHTATDGTAGDDSALNFSFGDNSTSSFDGKGLDVRLYRRALNASEIYQMWAPGTRWDLYLPVKRIWPVVVAAPAAGNPYYAYAQQ